MTNFFTISVKLLLDLWLFAEKKSNETKCEFLNGICFGPKNFCPANETFSGICATKNEICCKKGQSLGPNLITNFSSTAQTIKPPFLFNFSSTPNSGASAKLTVATGKKFLTELKAF